MVKVKICGITREEDAIAAIEAGADFLGFILYPPSPRAVTPDSVSSLIINLKRGLQPIFSRPVPPLLVGVFVNQPAIQIAEIMDVCGLDLAQLSGDEDDEELTDPRSPLFGRAYKAYRPQSQADMGGIINRYANFAIKIRYFYPRLLIDTPHKFLYGGSGQTGNWALTAELANTIPGVMLAGGLKPDNVTEAIRQVRPFAVDVAGGVESRPGIKDIDLIRAFVANAKAA